VIESSLMVSSLLSYQ